MTNKTALLARGRHIIQIVVPFEFTILRCTGPMFFGRTKPNFPLLSKQLDPMRRLAGDRVAWLDETRIVRICKTRGRRPSLRDARRRRRRADHCRRADPRPTHGHAAGPAETADRHRSHPRSCLRAARARWDLTR